MAPKREPAVLLRIKYDDNYLSAPTIAPTENVDDEESAPTVATEDSSTPLPTETVQMKNQHQLRLPNVLQHKVYTI